MTQVINVCTGISAYSLIVFASASTEEGFQQERQHLTGFAKDTGRRMIFVHQQDPKLSQDLKLAEMKELLDCETGVANMGKGEAIAIGIAVVAAAPYPHELGLREHHRNNQGSLTPCYKYIGFIDADNVFSGSVHEYCKEPTVLASTLLKPKTQWCASDGTESQRLGTMDATSGVRVEAARL